MAEWEKIIPKVNESAEFLEIITIPLRYLKISHHNYICNIPLDRLNQVVHFFNI